VIINNNLNKNIEPTYHYRCMPRHYLTDGELIVMPIQPTHIELVRQWRNAQMDVLRQSSYITEEQQVKYYEDFIWPDMKNEHPKNILLAIIKSDVLIGYGGLVHIAWEHKRAELSFLLDTNYTKDHSAYSNIFYEFLVLMKTLAFKDLSLERIFTETYALRKEHIAIIEQAGFILEGELRNHNLLAGNRVSSIIHGCLAYDLKR
jgi:RimJ/RimL family protein N-acetyltransferase